MNLETDREQVKEMAGTLANYIGSTGDIGGYASCAVYIDGYGICIGMTRAIAIEKMRVRISGKIVSAVEAK